MRNKLGHFVKNHSPSYPGNPKWKKGKHISPKTEFKKGDTRAKGEKASGYKNGKYIRNGKYVFILKNDHPFSRGGYVSEHRLVVESYIGRYLLPHEHVHHIGKKYDNRPHMLMAFRSRSAHMRFENNVHVDLSEIIFDGRLLQNIINQCKIQ